MDFYKLAEYLEQCHQPKYRLTQIRRNFYTGRSKSFSEMSDLPLGLRKKLDSAFSLLPFISSKLLASPHTQKALLTLSDGCRVETVLMDYGGWLTVCVSSQVGCSLGCRFCTTGSLGFSRNLTSDEIIGQVIFWQQQIFPRYVGRVVFMGMGEPFLNWDNLHISLTSLTSPDGLGIGQRKISLSTAGIIPKIIAFTNLHSQINLAVSLHSLHPQTRFYLMPVTKTYPLPDLLSACSFYTKTTHRQLFFEYSFIQGVNDTKRDIDSLIDFLKSNQLYFLNIIPLNRTISGIKPSSSEFIGGITKIFSKHHLNFSLRRSFGSPIMAACGQLAGGK